MPPLSTILMPENLSLKNFLQLLIFFSFFSSFRSANIKKKAGLFSPALCFKKLIRDDLMIGFFEHGPLAGFWVHL